MDFPLIYHRFAYIAPVFAAATILYTI